MMSPGNTVGLLVHFKHKEVDMFKNTLIVLLMMSFIGISVLAYVQTARVLYSVVELQVKHDLMLADERP